MKFFIIIAAFTATFHFCFSFMTFQELGEHIKRCYDGRDENRIIGNEIINGQTLPLPSSIETFISLVEQLEGIYPSITPSEMIRKLLVSFRADNIPPDLRFKNDPLRDKNAIEKALFGIDNVDYAFNANDIIDDDKCALHFMLSHFVNDSLKENQRDGALGDFSKRSREYGVVNIQGKKKQAFALGKVLLGIFAGLISNPSAPVNAAEIRRNAKLPNIDDRLNDVKINRLIAVTIADLIVLNITSDNFKRENIAFMQNGDWNDVSCPTDYYLEDNSKPVLPNALIRGAIDGLIIGKKIEDNQRFYKQLRLSEILRMYYGPTGLLDETVAMTKTDVRTDDHFCKRKDRLSSISNLNDEILNYLRLYAYPAKSNNLESYRYDIETVLSSIQGSSQIFDEDESNLCSRVDSSVEKYKTPSDIFAILDWQTTDNLKNFQIELLGMLSSDFEVRPKGNSLGAYTNLSPSSSKGLHVIANNSGIAGCPSCYARYFKRTGASRQGEVEVLNYLNQTLTEFIRTQDNSDDHLETIKIGKPSKVVLLFNFGNPVDDYRLRDAVWEIVRNFREVTMLAIGSKKDSLHVFTENDDQDIFTDINNVATLAVKLKARISKAPAEFQFKECYRSSRGVEAENVQTGFIPVNKKQYWAMYPKYFLKSYNLKLKFKALDGAQIKVCFSRHYYRILDDNQPKTCHDSGEEIVFPESHPCNKRNEHNCDPFYFSIEGQKPGVGICESRYCRTPKDIRFEFSHEGVSCNRGSFLISSVALLSLTVLILLKTNNLF